MVEILAFLLFLDGTIKGKRTFPEWLRDLFNRFVSAFKKSGEIPAATNKSLNNAIQAIEDALEAGRGYARSQVDSAVSVDESGNIVSQSGEVVRTAAQTEALKERFVGEAPAKEGTKSAKDDSNIRLSKKESEIIDLVKKSISEKDNNREKVILNERISDELAGEITNIVGFSVKGWKVSLSIDDVRHSVRRHGVNGLADSSMSDINEYRFLADIDGTYTKVEKTNSLSSKYRNSDGSKAKQILISIPKGEGTYYVAEAVPEAAAETIHVVSVYQTKKAVAQVPHAKVGPGQNVRNEVASTASDVTLAHETSEGKTNLSRDVKTEKGEIQWSKKISKESVDLVKRYVTDTNISFEEINNLPEIVDARNVLEAMVDDFLEQYPEFRHLPREEIGTHLINTEERVDQRKKLVEEMLQRGSYNGLDSEGNEVYDGPVERGRRLDVVMGPPAAGKSSVLVNPLSQLHNALVPDSDHVKERHEEYKNGIGAQLVHEESSAINTEVFKRALQEGMNIVLPIVGSKASSISFYTDVAKEKGYKIYLHLNEVSSRTAVSRGILRFFEKGRFIDPDIINNYGNKPSTVFEAERSKYDGYTRWNNEGPQERGPEIREYSRTAEPDVQNIRIFRETRGTAVEGDVGSIQAGKPEGESGSGTSSFSLKSDTSGFSEAGREAVGGLARKDEGIKIDGRDVEYLGDVMDMAQHRRFMAEIDNYKKSKYQKAADGDVIIPIDNMLVFTDFNKHDPGISNIFVFNTDNYSDIDTMSHWVSALIERGYDYEEVDTIIGRISEKGFFDRFSNSDFGNHERYDRQRERGQRRSDAYHAERKRQRKEFHFEDSGDEIFSSGAESGAVDGDKPSTVFEAERSKYDGYTRWNNEGPQERGPEIREYSGNMGLDVRNIQVFRETRGTAVEGDVGSIQAGKPEGESGSGTSSFSLKSDTSGFSEEGREAVSGLAERLTYAKAHPDSVLSMTEERLAEIIKDSKVFTRLHKKIRVPPNSSITGDICLRWSQRPSYCRDDIKFRARSQQRIASEHKKSPRAPLVHTEKFCSLNPPVIFLT